MAIIIKKAMARRDYRKDKRKREFMLG